MTHMTRDSDAWSRRWTNASLGQPDWFIAFARPCYGVGQQILVGTIADAIIRNAIADDFPFPIITILHLSFVLTSPHQCSPREIHDFFFSRLLKKSLFDVVGV